MPERSLGPHRPRPDPEALASSPYRPLASSRTYGFIDAPGNQNSTVTHPRLERPNYVVQDVAEEIVVPEQAPHASRNICVAVDTAPVKVVSGFACQLTQERALGATVALPERMNRVDL